MKRTTMQRMEIEDEMSDWLEKNGITKGKQQKLLLNTDLQRTICETCSAILVPRHLSR